MTEQKKKEKIFNLAKDAAIASRSLRTVSTEAKRDALEKIADVIDKKAEDILFRNDIDVEAAKEDDLEEALVDRLVLNEKRLKSMTDGIREVAGLDDPIGEVIEERTRPNGLNIEKVRVPLGVVGMIYESRPNVTGDAAALCLMSSNSIILRGGTEALNSNLAIGHYIRAALQDSKLSADAVQIIDDSDRKIVEFMVSLKGLIDIIIPRGSEQMIKTISKMSQVPVIGHGKGLCHIYLDKDADREKAVNIVKNAKVQRPGVCNAVETLLVHREGADRILPPVCRVLEDNKVELRGDEKAREFYNMEPADDEDWKEEYLSLTLAVKVVDNMDEAIGHIENYGSRHSDAIVTEDEKASEEFLNRVDSSCVYCNASTRFTDGNQMGLGAEIGISNQKLHARGPMGIKELTSYKYQLRGNGQIRE
ncbi:MAG: glutamate-5-semialdehyde dehydrogenase [Elusimicrobiota bacterium]